MQSLQSAIGGHQPRPDPHPRLPLLLTARLAPHRHQILHLVVSKRPLHFQALARGHGRPLRELVAPNRHVLDLPRDTPVAHVVVHLQAAVLHAHALAVRGYVCEVKAAVLFGVVELQVRVGREFVAGW